MIDVVVFCCRNVSVSSKQHSREYMEKLVRLAKDVSQKISRRCGLDTATIR